MIQEPKKRGGRRRSIKACALAEKHKKVLQPVYKEFQAMFLSLHGSSPRWESVNRHNNALLIIDAARVALGERCSEFINIRNDIRSEMGKTSDDGIR